MPCETPILSQIGDVVVCMRSDSRFVHAEFAHLYPMAPSCNRPADNIIQMEVKKAGRSRLGRRLYRVFGDGEEIGGLLRRAEVFPFLEWGINLRVIERHSQFVQLHAASMVRNGHGCIFAGASGCGKSTLSAALLARGWGYLSDEFALIDPRTLHLHPFPKALCIKAGSFHAIGRLGLRFAQQRHHIKGVKGRVGYINPASLGPNATAGVAPVRFVIFPKYEEGAVPKLESISPGRALLELAGCVFNRPTFAGDSMEVLAKTVRQSECFRLTTGELESTCSLLENHLSLPAQDAAAKTARMTPSVASPRQPQRFGGSTLFNRREALRLGAKLAYVAPAVVTFSAQQAFAAGSNPSDVCSTGVATGGLCETDTDCCSRRCNLGVCASNQ